MNHCLSRLLILFCLDYDKFYLILVSCQMRLCLCHIHLYDDSMYDFDSASKLRRNFATLLLADGISLIHLYHGFSFGSCLVLLLMFKFLAFTRFMIVNSLEIGVWHYHAFAFLVSME